MRVGVRMRVGVGRGTDFYSDKKKEIQLFALESLPEAKANRPGHL